MNIEKYTQNAQGAIIDCQNIAVEEGHQQIDGEHLHLALLMQKDGLIPKLLKKTAAAPFECGEKSRENEGRVCQCGTSLSGIAGREKHTVRRNFQTIRHHER